MKGDNRPFFRARMRKSTGSTCHTWPSPSEVRPELPNQSPRQRGVKVRLSRGRAVLSCAPIWLCVTQCKSTQCCTVSHPLLDTKSHPQSQTPSLPFPHWAPQSQYGSWRVSHKAPHTSTHSGIQGHTAHTHYSYTATGNPHTQCYTRSHINNHTTGTHSVMIN